MLNADFGRRGAIGDEAIEVLRTLWREPVASYAGEVYHLKDALFFPKPPRGTVPIWIGGNTPPAIRRAARLSDELERAGDYAAAIQQANRLLRSDPLREETYRRLMRLYALHGDRAAALRIYYTCATTLQQELGVWSPVRIRSRPTRACCAWRRCLPRHCLHKKRPLIAMHWWGARPNGSSYYLPGSAPPVARPASCLSPARPASAKLDWWKS